MAGLFSRRAFLRLAALASAGMGAGMGAGMNAVWPRLARAAPLAFEPNRSYWAETRLPGLPALETSTTADVAIIGGGYTGLSTAWHLLRRDPALRVLVLEAGVLGQGASGRHGGMVLPQISAEAFDIAHDEATHAQVYAITVASMRALRDLTLAMDRNCDLRLDGYVMAFLDEDERQDCQDYMETVRPLSMPLELLDEDEMTARLGTTRYAGGVFDPNGGTVHAMKLVALLREAVLRAGGSIVEQTPVTEVRDGRPLRLQTLAGHAVEADRVVLATNAYTAQLGFFRDETLPLHVESAATPPLTPAQIRAMGWNSRLPFYDSREALYHLVLTPDNRIIIGGGNAEYFPGGDTRYRADLAVSERRMRDELVRLHPSLRGVDFSHVWSGIIGMTMDETPAAGATGEHGTIHYALACNGQGVNLAFLFGDVLAARITGTAHPWDATRYGHHVMPPWPPEPLRRLGVAGATRYLRWRDR